MWERVSWDRLIIAADKQTREKDYWLKKLEDISSKATFPVDFKRHHKDPEKISRYSFAMTDKLAKRLRELSKGSDARLFIILAAAVTALLYKYSGQRDIIVGTPIFKPESEGEFINTVLTLRTGIENEDSFKKLLGKMQRTISEADEHRDYPIEVLVKQLGLDPDDGGGGFPLFDVSLLVDTIHEPSHIQYIPRDITFQFSPREERLEAAILYDPGLYRQDTIERITGHLLNMLETVLFQPDLLLTQVSIMPEQEKELVTQGFNNSRTDYPREQTVDGLFSEQVNRVPGNIALVENLDNKTVEWTYLELDRKARILADVLKEAGAGEGSVIVVHTSPSAAMVVALLGILKAGGVYLPINVDYPQERKDYILKDSCAKIVLNDVREETFPGLTVFDVTSSEIYNREPGVLKPSHGADAPIYIMYTSGSTGTPKGVMVTHRNVVRLVKNTNYVQFLPGDRILQTGALEFDASTFEIWGALLNGISVCLAEKNRIINPPQLKKIFSDNKITSVFITTALFNQMSLADVELFAPLRCILSGGDVMSPPHMNRVRERFPGLKIANVYGPTENTTFSSFFPIEGEYRDNIPIGTPIANSTTYIVDSQGQPVPIGVPGELWLGGDGVADGYLNNPGLTAEKFVDSPWGRCYRTGDSARWLPGGDIQFLGRIDQQVKIRGFRVEPGEIENRMMEIDTIDDVFVLAKSDDDGNKFLCAYFVAREKMDAQQVKDLLAPKMPAFMIPSYFVQMEVLPLTSNGKVDRRALPDPIEESGAGGGVAPRDDTEKELARIWGEVLGLEEDEDGQTVIGIDANYFDYGGHSLNAAVLVSRIHKSFDVNFPLKEVFVLPTIRQQAEFVKNSSRDKYTEIDAAEKREYYPVSAAQKRMYVLQQFDKQGVIYNIPSIFLMEGTLNTDKLEHCFRELILRHDSLRTSFPEVNGEPVQFIHEDVDFSVEQIYRPGLSEDETAAVMQQLIKPFELSGAPLMRVGLVNLGEDKYVLLVDMHHIISDGVSHGVLISDFADLYKGEGLPELRLQYKDFSQWQSGSDGKQRIREQEEWWQRQYEGEIPVLNLPMDYPRPSVQSFEGDVLALEFGETGTSVIHAMASKENLTLYMVFLGIYALLLSRLSGQEEVVVGTPVAGRGHADLQQIIGMFVNTLALRLRPSGDKSFLGFLSELKEYTLKAFENQDYQFEDLVDHVDVNRDVSRNPLFDTMFTFQDTGSMEARLEGLKISAFDRGETVAKFDLTLTVIEVDEQLVLFMNYCTRLFKESTIRRFMDYFKTIVDIVSADPRREISEIDILSEEEKQQILFDFNHVGSRYPDDKTIHGLFGEQVEKVPEQTALVDNGISLSYRELNERADLLAGYLVRQGVQVNELVGLLATRTKEMIIGILGILKSRAAYVPLNPKAPASRNKYMLEDCASTTLVTTKDVYDNGEKTSGWNGNIIFIEDEFIEDDAMASVEPATRNPQSATSLAYVIFTSGTTGQPKGVPIAHSNFSPLVHWGYDKHGLGPGDRALQNLSYYFDWSVWEIFITLTSGAALYMVPGEILLNPEACIDFMNENQITVLHVTPTQYSYIANVGRKVEFLKYLFLGAEKLTLNLVQRSFASVNPGCRLFNMYGPTEATIISATLEIGEDYEEKYKYLTSIPIGEAAANVKHYILDNYMKPCPVGVFGELYIAGDGLSSGYLNNPLLADEKFIHSTYGRLYKTGDLARWLTDGTIEFMGRIDLQVKIRGFRIELGEIENSLLTHDNVKETVVTAKEGDNKEKFLCAYIVGTFENTDAQTTQEVKEFLARSLPDYMIPTYFVFIEKMPLNPNGKVNMRALPEPETSGTQEFVAPANEVEEKIAGTWSEVLGLPVEEISTDANFFELGGHSLKATMLTAKLHREFNVEIPMAEIFRSPSIRGLASFISGASEEQFITIEQEGKKDFYPLSSPQRRLFILQQIDRETTAYNMPQCSPIKFELNKETLTDTFRQLILRHDTLRTSFRVEGDEPVQYVHDDVDFSIEEFDSDEQRFPEQIFQEFIRPFDLSQAPMLRVGLIKKTGGQYIYFMLDMHHIISDGVSDTILLREFQSLMAGQTLPPLKFQYKDYVEWYNSPRMREMLKQQEKWWLGQFETGIPILELPTDYRRPALQSFEGHSLYFDIPGKTSFKLIEITSKEEATFFMLILAAFNVLLSRLTGQEDVVVGTPVSGRTHADFQTVIGMFVNTLPLRNYPSASKTFKEFLREVKDNALMALQYQDYPFEDLVENLDVVRDAGRNPLFDVMLQAVNENESTTAVDDDDDEKAIESVHAKFDITFGAIERTDKLQCFFNYSTRLFKQETMERYCGYMKQLLTSIALQPDTPIGELDFIPSQEKLELLYNFNNTEVSYPKDKTVYRLFEEQVERTPGETAVIAPPETLTYRQLNEKANRLARLLRQRGIEANTVTGVMMPRSANMLIALYAVLKAGGTYLPIDPQYPEQRIINMLNDSRAAVLVTASDTLETKKLDGISPEIVMPDRLENELAAMSPANPEPVSQPGDMIYIIFTSGSTGIPKGAGVFHRGFVNLLSWFTREYKLNNRDRNLLMTSFSFDLTQKNLYASLLTGGILCIPPVDHFDPVELVRMIESHGVTWINCTPSMFFQLTEYCAVDNYRQLESLRYVYLGGEVLAVSMYMNWLKAANCHAKLVNTYGPTECTDISNAYVIGEPGNFVESAVPVGDPIYNVQLFVLDSRRRILPVGLPGELCIGGDSVGAGYVNDRELTADKFITVSFEPGKDIKLYRTGDVVKWRPEGVIEFIGRLDDQVKVRGFRIELGEIESRLMEYQSIKEAVVMARDGGGGDKFLCAYIIPGENGDGQVKKQLIKQYLSRDLPEYMVPGHYVVMEKFPLSPNGKVARDKLPEPGTETGKEYTAPRNDMEELLAETWAEVLKVELGQIGIDDSFFELGGHSLKATMLIAKLYRELDVEIPLGELFKMPTIRGLSSYIDKAEKSERFVSLQHDTRREFYRLSSAQRRLFILQQIEKDSTVYNMPMVLPLPQKLDRNKLEKAFQQLIQRHETLRTSFAMGEEEPVQYIHDHVDFEVQSLDIEPSQSLAEVFREFAQPFDLARAPLFRAALVNTPGGEPLLMVDLHHIVTDGFSNEILVNEFDALYKGHPLPPLEFQYKDYAKWQNSDQVQKLLEKQKEWWLGQFESGIPVLAIPTDYSRPAVQSFEGHGIEFSVSSEISAKLKEIASQKGVTMFMTVLAAFNVMLSRLTGQEDIVVGTPVSGRTHADFQAIIGMFVNTLVLRNYPTGSRSFAGFLEEVGENTLGALKNQDYPFEDLVEILDVTRDAGRNPLFDVMLQVGTSGGDYDSPGDSNDSNTDVLSSAKFDLTLAATEYPDKMDFYLNYCTRLFKQETMERFAGYLKQVLVSITDNPQILIGELEFIPPQEKQELLYDFNKTVASYPKDKTVYRLFEEQVERTPGETAIIASPETLTYLQLNEKANRLARLLRQRGIGANTVTGIMMPRSADMLIALYAVLKAGGTYLPIDPQYPEQRIINMLNESSAAVLVTAADTLESKNLDGISSQIVMPGRLENELAGMSPANPEPVSQPGDMIYIIFTSGSTGIPKGAGVYHRGFVNLLNWFTREYQLKDGDANLLMTSFSFDLTQKNLYASLLTGGVLCIPPVDHFDPVEVVRMIETHGVTWINCTPSMFFQLTEFCAADNYRQLESLRYVYLGGEVLSVGMFVNWLESPNCNAKMVNTYGPTECTDISNAFVIREPGGFVDSAVPIGDPIYNVQLYVLDSHRRILPVGLPGELCIGGDSIGYGYINDRELTADKFITVSIEPGKEIRVYRTGDVAKWLPGGVIEFIGRLDDQVKIRGFRIELGEIESRLMDYESIKEAVVLAKDTADGEKYLCAYIIPVHAGTGAEPVTNDFGVRLKEYLRQSLPEYMVPDHYVVMEQFPLSPNGKVDKDALPEPEAGTGREYTPPRGELEEMLVETWAELLNLEREKIGIDDSFFELGGHSLKATMLIAKLHRNLDVEVPMAEIFKLPTIRGLATYIKNADRARFISIKPVDNKQYYKLSSAQRRLFILQQIDKESIVYNMPMMIPLADKPDNARLEETFHRLIRRHSSLRTSFHIAAEEPVQKIHNESPFGLEEYRVGPERSGDDIFREFVRPFELNRAPLLRAALVEEQGKSCFLMVDLHHIIADGVSNNILGREFEALYEGRTLPPLKLQYKDYANWQNSKRVQRMLKKQEKWWVEQFRTGIPVLALPADYRRPTVQHFDGDSVNFDIPMETERKLREITAREGGTIFITLMAAFSTLLSRLTGQEDIVVGTPVSGRTHADLQPVIGMFVNTLPLRNMPAGSLSFTQFMQEVRTNTLDALKNQDYPFEDLVEVLDVTRDAGRNPLFDVMLQVERLEDSIAGQDELAHLQRKYRTAKFDITLAAEEHRDKIIFVLNYCTRLFKRETMERYAEYFKQLLAAITDNPQTLIGELEFIPPQEKLELLYGLNNTGETYPEDKTVYRLFEEQVERTPGETAVIATPGTLTYRELNEKANRLAHFLRQRGVGANTVTGIMMPRSIHLLISLYAVLKAGGTYLPIDPQYPAKRVVTMLNDSDAAVLVTTTDIAGSMNREEVSTQIVIPDRLEDELAGMPPENPEPVNQPGDRIYIIFTSGSTGIPKGAGVYHRGFVNLLNWFTREYKLNSRDRNLLMTSFSFDLTQKNLYASLLTGGVLCIPPVDHFDPVEMVKIIENHKITWINCTPSMFFQLTEYCAGDNYRQLKSLRYVYLGGEVLSVGMFMNWLNSADCRAKLVNTYGPTECTDISNAYVIEEPGKFVESAVPIGKPIYNVQLFVLDPQQRILPVGLPGELCIGGDSVGNGYVNDNELTNEKFINIKLPEQENGSLVPGAYRKVPVYRTGDVVKWLPEGVMEFTGRLDDQVKVRGFRIELGEIENRLMEHRAVKEAVVLAKDSTDGGKYLCAYIVIDGPGHAFADSKSQLKEYLKQSLPEYMVPDYYVIMDRFPLSPNGKVDRDALPEPEAGTGREYAPPRNELDEILTATWAGLLEMEKEKIGIDDSFFELGGHSLKATMLIAKLYRQLKIEVPLAQVFQSPTIRGLSSYIEQFTAGRFISIQPVEKKEYYPISSAQKRIFLLQQMDQNSTVYNVPDFIQFDSPIPIEQLKSIFARLIRQHESLRTSFHMIKGEPAQRVHDNVSVTFKTLTPDSVRSFIRPFDISRAPLLRVGLMEAEEGRQLMVVDMHHIITDGFSRQLLINDFMALYRGEELTPLRLSYKDYAQWQIREVQKESYLKQERYWLEEFSGEIPVLELPADFSRPPIQSFEGKNYPFYLEPGLTQQFNALALKLGSTVFMMMLTAFKILLWKLSGQEDIIVGSPIAGRSHADLEHIIGMFVNTLALRSFPSGDKSFTQYLEEIKEKTLPAFENQDYPFEELVDKVVTTRDASRNPLFDVVFSKGDDTESERKKSSVDLNIAKFDLTLHASQHGDKYHLLFEYCTRLFKDETIQRFSRYLKTIIETIIKKPGVLLSGIDILSGEERKQILVDFNSLDVEYPYETTIHGLFERQVERTPDRPALVDNGRSMTFRELNERSGILAALLIERGVKENELVGLLTTRTKEMIIGILGILKTGAGYVPINPKAPASRNIYMLEDCDTQFLVTTREVYAEGEKTGDWKGNVVYIEDSPKDGELVRLLQPATRNPQPATSTAYVIFTSGTTGQPKGVPITHANFSPLVHWGYDKLGIGSEDRALQNLSYYFDWSVWEIFITLTSGAALYMVPEEILLNPEACIDFMDENQITVLHVTPTQYSYIANVGRKVEYMKYLFLGAEKLTLNLVQRSFDSVNPGCRLFNMYGPTEATIISAVLEIGEDYQERYSQLTSIPIGLSAGNTAHLILDKSFDISPVNTAGELYIAGDGVARGYLNRTQLTAEKFVGGDERLAELIAEAGLPTGTRIYSTGDLARWLPDGEIEFLGRIDHQVKIRGFRIELGEIENRLLTHDNVKECVLVAKDGDGSEKFLCAYIVGAFDDPDIQPAQLLKEFLAESLPDYMIPTYFVFIDKMPLNPNGKVNLRALPEPEITTGETFVAPRDEFEEKLAELWSGVLDKEKETISIDDDFFMLGGHSLKATVMVSRIHKTFDVEFPLAQIFTSPTIRGLAAIIKNTAGTGYDAIQQAGDKSHYPLSPAQNRLYIIHQMIPESVVYNMPQFVPLPGTPDRENLESILRQLIQRHESLRTSFHIIDGAPVQKIHKDVRFSIEDFTQLSDQYDPYKSFVRPFDLSKAPLLRVGLARTGEESHLLMIDMHHIISDGISNIILVREFQQLSTGGTLQPLRIQYKDFAEWLNLDAQQAKLLEQEKYWKTIFQNEIPVLEVPTDYARPSLQSFEGKIVRFDLEREIVDRLNAIAAEQGSTLYMVLMGLSYVLLAKLSGQEDIVIGTPTAGRRHSDFESVIGMFVNTLPIRNFPAPGKSFKEFLNEIKTNTLDAFENQEYPFEELVDKLEIRRDTGRNPLFDFMFSLQNIQGAAGGETTGSETTDSSYEERVAKFDLTLVAKETGNKLSYFFQYCTRLFKEDTIRKFARYYRNIALDIIDDPGKSIAGIRMLEPEERKQILVDFNSLDVEYPYETTIHGLFERQVEKTPDRPALVDNGQSMTYRELNERSGVLAALLIERGVKENELVGLLTTRTKEMITGILGILKTGAGYVPINPKAPASRNVYMLEDCDTRFLVTTHDVYAEGEKTGDWKGNVVYIEDSQKDGVLVRLLQPATRNPQPATSTAYVIFTSGTTGQPKGVPITHANFSPLVHWGYDKLGLGSEDRALQNLSYYFDWSVWEIFITLTSGAALYMVPEEILLNPETCIDFMNENQITVLHVTPTQYSYIANVGRKAEYMKYLFLGAEKLTLNLVERSFASVNPGCRLFNMYGPTEATIISAVLEIGEDYQERYSQLTSIPIGLSAGNTAHLILDKSFDISPVNTAGELYIAGDGVARGYLNRTQLTGEKFVGGDERLAALIAEAGLPAGTRIYSTGDLARWLPDGEIEFLGRIDHQVKIRGFRIELGEIENRLFTHDDVKECVLVAKDGDGEEKFLCAYIVGTFDDPEIQPTRLLKEFLAESLPDYMIPSYFVFIDKIPLNPNGKVNLRALPEPEITAAETIAPRNSIENQLAATWSDVLNIPIDSIGIDDNFFERGGHSLKATLLAAGIRKQFGIQIPLLEIFQSPTIRALNEYILQDDTAISISPADEIHEKNLVTLRKGDQTDKHLFMIHDGSGDVEAYIGFSRDLDPGYHCWGLRADRLSHYTPHNIDIPDIARKYIEKIKSVQSTGPYNIGGWSIGGTIAFEMVRQLESMGETINCLALIDAMPPDPLEAEEASLFTLDTEKEWLKVYFSDENFRQVIPGISDLHQLWPDLIQYMESIPLDTEQVRNLIQPEIASTIPNIREQDIHTLIHYMNIIRSLYQSRQRYVPGQKIDSPAVYIAASETTLFEKTQWNNYCQNPIRVHTLQGSHHQLFLPPLSKKLAEIFNKFCNL